MNREYRRVGKDSLTTGVPLTAQSSYERINDGMYPFNWDRFSLSALSKITQSRNPMRDLEVIVKMGEGMNWQEKLERALEEELGYLPERLLRRLRRLIFDIIARRTNP